MTAHGFIVTDQADMPFYCHSVRTFGYIFKGQLYGDILAGKSTQLIAGDALRKVMKTMHRGKVIGVC